MVIISSHIFLSATAETIRTDFLESQSQNLKNPQIQAGNTEYEFIQRRSTDTADCLAAQIVFGRLSTTLVLPVPLIKISSIQTRHSQ